MCPSQPLPDESTPLTDEERRIEEFFGDTDDLDDFDEINQGRSSRKFPMHCFFCNRREGFFSAYRGFWWYSYIQGMTFGIASFFGPFKCQCCGNTRLLCYDWCHPKIWTRDRGKSSKKKKRRKSRSHS